MGWWEVRNITEEKETLGCGNHCVTCVSCLLSTISIVVSCMTDGQVGCFVRDMSALAPEWVILPLIYYEVIE